MHTTCLALILVLTAGACGASSKAPPAAAAPARAARTSPRSASCAVDLVDSATGAGNLTVFLQALEATELVGSLRGPGPLTVLAPSDEAFAKLPQGTVEAWLADPTKLTSVLAYHLISGTWAARDLAARRSVTASLGGELRIELGASDTLKINGAGLVRGDVRASNGVLHVIDTVLVPE